MSTYEPGTVAVATVRGVKDVRLVRGEGHWALAADTDDFITDHNASALIADLRPLVVLDLDDSAQIDSLCKALVEAMHAAGDRYSAANGVHPATVRAALESLTKPPRIPEPGLWGVVFAAAMGGIRHREFVRHADGWIDADGKRYDWNSLDFAALVREGVQS